MNYNKCIIGGHLTKDWELRTSQSGSSVAKSGIAVNHRYKDKEEVCFVDLTAFGQTAEILAEHTQKGSAVLVEGRLQLERWEKDGKQHSKHSIVVDRFEFGGKREDAPAPEPRKADGKWKSRPEKHDLGSGPAGRMLDDAAESADYGEIPF